MDKIQLATLREKVELQRKNAQQTVNDRAKQNKKLIHSKKNTPQPPRSRRATRIGRTGVKRAEND